MELGGLVSLLVAILIIVVIVYAVRILVDYLGVPQPIRALLYLIIAVVVIVWLLNRFGVAI